MERLPLTEDEVTQVLPAAPKKYLKERERELHFFKIRYSDDEIIMPRGSYSDFAGVQLQGIVSVHDAGPPPSARRKHPGECWHRPGWLKHRLEGWVLDRADRLEQLSAAQPWLRWLRPYEQRLAAWLRPKLAFLVKRSAERLTRNASFGRSHAASRCSYGRSQRSQGWAAESCSSRSARSRTHPSSRCLSQPGRCQHSPGCLRRAEGGGPASWTLTIPCNCTPAKSL